MLSFALALQHPELVAYALPVSGMLPALLWPATGPGRARVPEIHALHGTADTVVAFDADARLVEHLQKLGYAASLAPFADIGHRVAPAMSADARSALTNALAQ
jgi:phospholipase/carboxylesterase